MKNALFIFIVFIILSIVASLVFALGFSLVFLSFSMIAGEVLSFVRFSTFLHILVLCIPFSLVIACLGLVFYFIRHPRFALLPTILYFLIGLSVWIFAIPFLVPLPFAQEPAMEKKEGSRLSEFVFRSSESSIDYITLFLPDAGAEGIRINRAGKKEMQPVVFDETYLSQTSELFYADPVFEETVRLTPILEVLKDFFIFARTEVLNSLARSYISYLMFASFGLALLSIFFIKNINKWKLINVSLVVALFVLVCKLNREIFSANVFNKIIEFFLHNNIRWLGNHYNLQFIINMSISLIFSLIGFFHFVIERKKAKREQS